MKFNFDIIPQFFSNCNTFSEEKGSFFKKAASRNCGMLTV